MQKKTNDAPNRPPQHIQHPKSNHNITLAVDRTGCTGKSVVVLGHLFEANLLAIDSRSSFAWILDFWRFPIGHRIGLGTRDQMMPVVQKPVSPVYLGGNDSF